MEKNKRLYRSKNNRVFAGICGGLGEYADVDPVLLRLVWLLVTIFTGVVPGVVAYVLAVFVIPQQPIVSEQTPTPTKTDDEVAAKVQ